MKWQGPRTTFTLVWVAEGFRWDHVPFEVLVCNWAFGHVHTHVLGGECMDFHVCSN